MKIVLRVHLKGVSMKKTVVLSLLSVLSLSTMLPAEPYEVHADGETLVTQSLSGVDSALTISLEERAPNVGDEPESHEYVPPSAEVIALTHQSQS